MQQHSLGLRERAFLAAYPWRRVRPVPTATLSRPVVDARVALVTTAGLVPPDQSPFDLKKRGGDASFRVIGNDVDPETLALVHRSDAFDRKAVRRDVAVAFPLVLLNLLAADHSIGMVAPRHLSFMGSITAPGRLIRETAPAAADLLLADRIDIALLAPV
jgi:hypothetical protein